MWDTATHPSLEPAAYGCQEQNSSIQQYGD
jgi:hypothetical protein